MDVLNKRERRRARVRFWIGYFLALALSVIVIYQSTRLGSIERNLDSVSLAQMKQRDGWWKDLGLAAQSLNAIRDVALRTTGGSSNLSGKDLATVNQQSAKFNELVGRIESYCYLNDSVGYRSVLQLVSGMRGYEAQLQKFKDDTNEAVEKKLQTVKMEYEAEIRQLEQELRDKDREIRDLDRAMRSQKPG